MTGKPRACTSSGCGARTVARRLCRAHYQAAWKAGELGSYEKLPTRPRLRDRTICPPDHKHANATTCFIQHQCRCDPCMDHNTAREARRKKDIAYGRYDSGLVDAAPVREHLLMLGEFGLGYKRVAALAGLGITPVRTLIWGRQDPGPRKGEMQKRVSKRTAERILAVRPSVDHLAGGASVPARGAHRRVQALVARGWSLSKIARNIGWSGENFSAMMLRDSISASTYRAIADLYKTLWDVAPPEETHRDKIAASRARRHASDRGWGHLSRGTTSTPTPLRQMPQRALTRSTRSL